MLTQLHVGMKMRIAACSMIYRKSLRLTKNVLGDTTTGQVVNLLSNDVSRLELAVLFVHYLWVGPLEVVIVFFVMYREIQISAIFGILFLLLFVPLQIVLGKLNSKLRLKTALRTDERVRMMNEIIQGIQVIKMYAWEKPLSVMVEAARKKEIHVIRYVSYLRGILLSFIMFTTRVSVFLSLVGYALLGNQITAQKAFMITALYNMLRQSMTVFFPQGVGQLAETVVSVQRIQKFMLSEELPSSDNTCSGDDATTDVECDGSVSFTGVSAKWSGESTENTLTNINLSVPGGTLLAIVGPVGAGKSSLLNVVLRELKIDAGAISIKGSVSYAAQEPWLFSSSVKQNILFGLPMDKEKYRKVVKCCALERDFELLPNGDRTLMGDRGVSLSGGQKARINLARSLYRDASIYLLDDPLSAVDTHVSLLNVFTI